MIFGAEYISTEDFKLKCDELKALISTDIDELSSSIDADKNGMISVRETVDIFKYTIKMYISIVKGWFA